MGGTSIWFTSLAIGIILSVSKDLEQENNEELSLITEEDEE
jgi:cell division protein FtsW (lipid II flippase)